MNIPQLDLVIGKDNFRPQLQVALVTKEYTYATTAHVLVRHNTSVLFDEEFIKSLPKEGIGLTVEIIKAIRKKTVIALEIGVFETIILKSIDKKKYPDMIFRLPDISNFNFPNYEKVIVSEKDSKPLDHIAFNPRLLGNAIKALATDTDLVRVFFTEDTKAILIRPKDSVIYSDSLAILMPVIF